MTFFNVEEGREHLVILGVGLVIVCVLAIAYFFLFLFNTDSEFQGPMGMPVAQFTPSVPANRRVPVPPFPPPPPLPPPLSIPGVSGGLYETRRINGYMTAVAGDRYLRVTAPNTNVSLCMGNNYTVKWESGGLRTVNVMVRNAGGAAYSIGSFPASFNDMGTEDGKGYFVWKVGAGVNGAKIPEGYAYEVVINSADGGLLLNDSSDNVFSILQCEG